MAFCYYTKSLIRETVEKLFDLNLIKTFLTVYKLQSITRAADALDVTQPAVSAAIKRFESTVGYALFTRAGRSIAPTSMAHKLAEQLSEAMGLIEGAVAQDRDLVVYAPANILFLLPQLDGVRVKESPVSVEEVLDDIRLGKVDLVIDTGLPKEAGLVFEFAVSDRLLIMSDPEYSNYSTILTNEDYFEAQHITLRMLRQNVQIVELLTDHSISRKEAIEVRNVTNLIMALKGKSYLAAVPESMVPIVKMLGLKLHEAPFEMRGADFEFIYHKKHASNGALKALRDTLLAHFSSMDTKSQS